MSGEGNDDGLWALWNPCGPYLNQHFNSIDDAVQFLQVYAQRVNQRGNFQVVRSPGVVSSDQQQQVALVCAHRPVCSWYVTLQHERSEAAPTTTTTSSTWKIVAMYLTHSHECIGSMRS